MFHNKMADVKVSSSVSTRKQIKIEVLHQMYFFLGQMAVIIVNKVA